MDRQGKPINNTEYMGLRYIIDYEDYGKFKAILTSNMTSTFICEKVKKRLTQKIRIFLKLNN